MLLKLSSDLTFPGMHHVCHTHTQHRAYNNNGKEIIFRWEEQSSSHFHSSPFFATTFGLDLESSLILDLWSSVRLFKRPGLRCSLLGPGSVCKLASAPAEFKLSQQALGKASLENTNAPSSF